MEVSFTINGVLYKISPHTVPITTTLVTYIREYAHLKGTKFMCLEGGCGACVVTLKGTHPVTKKVTTWAVNSCLQNIYSCHGLDIITVEGIGSKKTGLHQVQSRLANFNGTQCGYCSPGMVMNMYSLLESKDGKVSMEEVENSFGGNICRCTGYRPILDAFKSLATDADQSLLDLCKDIEDLSEIKNCPRTGSPCAGTCSASEKLTSKNPVKLTFEDDQEWHKVYSIKDIFAVLGKVKYTPYMLVAGNTAHGVYRRSTDLKVFIDISSVEELKGFKLNDNSLELGGNVTLTEAMEIFTQIAAEKQGFEYLEEIVKHIDMIANVAVRNSGTLAGNLMMKYWNTSFPSDIYLILEAVNAQVITMSGENEEHSPLAPQDFLNISMRRKIIGKIVFPALKATEYIYRSYKVMPRAQNSQSYVNAAFLIQSNGQEIKSARVCFGGINPEQTHIEKLEKFLIGKSLYNNEILQEAIKILNNELAPDTVLPNASPEYRKSLAIALFYKFVLNTAPSGTIQPSYESGASLLKRDISSGKQEFERIDSKSPLNKRIPKVEADIQCSGEAQYVNDLPKQVNELYAAFVLGTEVNAKILNFDPSQALNIPGVAQFFSAKDIPGLNNFMPLCFGFNYKVEEVLCSEKLLYHGQPVGIIVADTFELAYRAADLVKVNYEKSDEPIYPTIREVYKANCNERLINQPNYEVKATDYGTNIKHKLNGHFDMASTQYHMHMETQQCVCVPTEDGMDIYSSTQWVDNVHIAVAEVLNVPQNSLNLYVRRLGGAFGGKISRPSQIACAAALACHLLKRPIRLIMTMESNIAAIGKRFSALSDYEVEVDDNGKIQKLKNHYIQDVGCSLNEPVHFNTTPFIKNCYDFKSWDITTQSAVTNSASNTWMRAPGTTEAIAMTEHIMEHIARKTGKDPVDVRLQNLSDDSEFKTLLPEFVKSVEYRERKADINKFNDENRWKKRGIAIVPMKYYIFYMGSMHGIVSIYHGDGTIAICHGGIEMGQGLNTKAIQVASHVLGLPMNKFSIKPFNTTISPNDVGSVASVTSEIVCYVVKNACEDLLQRLKPVRDENPNDSWEQLVEKAFLKNIDLSATSYYKDQDMEPYFVYGLSCAEVEVDILTGSMLLKRVDILEDTGESMSPGMDIGQVEGGFIMGLGIWLTENLVYDPKNGELLTNRTWNYKPPGAKDIPVDFRINFIQKKPNPFFVLRSKATGEPPVTMAVVVAFALRYAIDAARRDVGLKDEDYYVLSAPLSPEKLFLAANNKLKDYKLN